jgi:hypothetical protein
MAKKPLIIKYHKNMPFPHPPNIPQENLCFEIWAQ